MVINMVFVDFKNDIEVTEQRSRIIFTVKDEVLERDGVGILDYLEMLINGHMDYIYYHYGDDPMTKIVINSCDYYGWVKETVENGTDMRCL